MKSGGVILFPTARSDREQVKVGTATLTVSCSIASQQLAWEDLGLSTHLVSLSPERTGGAGRQHPTLPAGRVHEVLSREQHYLCGGGWLWLCEEDGSGQVMGNQRGQDSAEGRKDSVCFSLVPISC